MNSQSAPQYETTKRDRQKRSRIENEIVREVETAAHEAEQAVRQAARNAKHAALNAKKAALNAIQAAQNAHKIRQDTIIKRFELMQEKNRYATVFNARRCPPAEPVHLSQSGTTRPSVNPDLTMFRKKKLRKFAKKILGCFEKTETQGFLCYRLF